MGMPHLWIPIRMEAFTMKIDRRCWAKALAATWALSLLSAGGIALTDTAGAEGGRADR